MKTIKLTQGRVALVGDDDFEELSRYKWHFHGQYARRNEWVAGGKGKMIYIYMHRYVMCTPQGMDTDHINGNKLDNRRENLRVCSRSENNANMGRPSHNTSGYRGVSLVRKTGKWQARINRQGKLVYCAYFRNKMDAVRAYNDKFAELYGDFAKLNKIGEI